MSAKAKKSEKVILSATLLIFGIQTPIQRQYNRR